MSCAQATSAVPLFGDVTPEQVRTLAEKYYGVLPPNPELAPRQRPQEPGQSAARRLVFEDPRVSQPYVTRNYLAPERNPGDQETAAALTILAEILGGGNTSFLNERLQFDQKLAVYTGAFYSGASLDKTAFNVTVVPTQGVSLEKAETAMDEALAAFMETDIDQDQLDRIKMQLRASQIYARDNVETIANRYGRALTSGLTIEDVQAWPDVLQSVTAEDVKAAAEMVFNDRHSVTGWLAAPAREEVSQ